MQIAQADTTPEFGVVSAANTSGKLREVDLNETPVTQNKRLRSRVDALMKTGMSSTKYVSQPLHFTFATHSLFFELFFCFKSICLITIRKF